VRWPAEFMTAFREREAALVLQEADLQHRHGLA
jgi:hypothetical protein